MQKVETEGNRGDFFMLSRFIWEGLRRMHVDMSERGVGMRGFEEGGGSEDFKEMDGGGARLGFGDEGHVLYVEV